MRCSGLPSPVVALRFGGAEGFIFAQQDLRIMTTTIRALKDALDRKKGNAMRSSANLPHGVS